MQEMKHRLIMIFQSTLPVKGATGTITVLQIDSAISIHAPREGSDTANKEKRINTVNFNPRSP